MRRFKSIHQAQRFLHQRQDIQLPDWVPETVLDSAKRLSTPHASAEIEVWLQRYGGASQIAALSASGR